MENKINVKNWIIKFNQGEFDQGDFYTQVKAGWFDWFCKDTSLLNKTKRMGRIIKRIKNEKLLNSFYVWFKNNCPVCRTFI